MKIVEIHTHVSVSFGPRKREHRHFSMADVKKFKGVEFELIPNIGVRITNAEDSVVVPFVNITAIRTEAAQIVQPTKAEAEVLGLNDVEEQDSDVEDQDSDVDEEQDLEYEKSVHHS